MKLSRTFEENYRFGINRFCLLVLAGHIPAAMLVAACYGSGVLSAFLIGAALLAGPMALYRTAAESQFTSAAMASAMMGMSALSIHLSHGLIEMHFHIFAGLALLVGFGSIWPVLTAAGTIALHHTLFWPFLPTSAFNYKAGFGIVLLHASIVILKAIPACWVARTLGRSIKAQGITTGSLTFSAEDVRSAASEIKTASVDLARWSSEQVSTLAQTSASNQQVAAMTAQLSQESQSAFSSMTVVDAQLTEANAELSKLATSMQAMRDRPKRF